MADRQRPGGGGGQDPGQDENVPQRHAMVSSRRPTCPLAPHLPEVRPLGRHVATLQSPQPDSRITQTQRRRKEITPVGSLTVAIAARTLDLLNQVTTFHPAGTSTEMVSHMAPPGASFLALSRYASNSTSTASLMFAPASSRSRP